MRIWRDRKQKSAVCRIVCRPQIFFSQIFDGVFSHMVIQPLEGWDGTPDGKLSRLAHRRYMRSVKKYRKVRIYML